MTDEIVALPISPRKYSQLLLFLYTTNFTVIILVNSVPLIGGKTLRYRDQLMPFETIMGIYSKTYSEYITYLLHGVESFLRS